MDRKYDNYMSIISLIVLILTFSVLKKYIHRRMHTDIHTHTIYRAITCVEPPGAGGREQPWLWEATACIILKV